MKLHHNALSVAVSAGLRIFNATITLDDLNDKLIELTKAAKGVQARADAENRPLTADEQADVTQIFASFSDTEAEIDRRKSILEMEAKMGAPNGRKTEADPVLDREDPAAAAVTRAQAAASRQRETARHTRVEAIEDRNKWGFRSAGEYLMAVKNSSQRGANIDPRLLQNAAPGSYGAEGVGADGGFAVPPDFRAKIIEKVMGEASLLAMTDQQESSSNNITFPTDETTPWQSTGGIQAYWDGEAGQKTTSKPALKEVSVKLNKLIALVPLTDELLEDAPAMASYVNRKAPEKIEFKINDAIFNGTGVGQPLGILNSPGTVVVAAESGQTADTVNFQNILKLYSAVTPSAQKNAAWFINQDLDIQLMSMQFPGTGTAVPVYMPPGGLSASPYGTLMGRPIIKSEALQPLGDKGDIVFGDMKQYLSLTKTGGMRTDVSIHIWFDYDITAFRFVLRIGGQPWWNSTIAPAHAGSSARGFFATLAARP